MPNQTVSILFALILAAVMMLCPTNPRSGNESFRGDIQPKRSQRQYSTEREATKRMEVETIPRIPTGRHTNSTTGCHSLLPTLHRLTNDYSLADARVPDRLDVTKVDLIRLLQPKSQDLNDMIPTQIVKK